MHPTQTKSARATAHALRHEVQRDACEMSSKRAGIREAVKVLLALLTDCGCPHIPSESFRQAKYNSSEAVQPFWTILYHLVHVHLYLKSGKLGDIRSIKEEGGRAHIQFVRRHALELNYHRHGLYIDTAAVDSCELLLFFAWLLKETSLVSQLETYHINAVKHGTSIPLAPSKQFLLENLQSHIASIKSELCSLTMYTHNGLSFEDALRKIQFIKGVLQGSCRSVENAHRAAVKLSHNIHQSCTSESSQLPQASNKQQCLSIHDVFLLRYPEQLSACVKSLEWDITSLNNIIKWREHEPVFWQWMESVLDQHTITHNIVSDEDRVSDTTQLTFNIDVLNKEVTQYQQKLSEMITEKNIQLERLYKSHKNKEDISTKSSNDDIRLKPVRIETSVLRPHLQHGHIPAGLHDHSSFQYRTVEEYITQLQTSIKQAEKELKSCMTAVSTSIPVEK